MKNKPDNYDLAQPSISGKPGFDLFHNKKSGEYFFHFNDASGKPLLFSEGYSASDGRDNGVRSVIENAADEKRYKIQKEKNGYFFVLKAKNHREIARSKHFPDKASMEEAMEYIQTKAPSDKKSTAPPAPKQAAITATTPKTTVKGMPSPIQKAETPPLTAPKYLFKIELYPRNEENGITGKIYSAINDKSIHFNGMDMDAISGFIKSQLPSDMAKMIGKSVMPAPQKAEGKPQETAAASRAIGKEESAPPPKPETIIAVKGAELLSLKGKVKGRLLPENLQIQVHREDDPAPSISLPVQSPLKLELKLMKGSEGLVPNGVKIPMELSLKSLSNNRLTNLGDFQLSDEAIEGTEAPLSFRIPYQGVFRIIARSKSSEFGLVEGSLLVSGT